MNSCSPRKHNWIVQLCILGEQLFTAASTDSLVFRFFPENCSVVNSCSPRKHSWIVQLCILGEHTFPRIHNRTVQHRLLLSAKNDIYYCTIEVEIWGAQLKSGKLKDQETS
ncbi:hypothetical protein AVEN_16526-1 [Araneus ventricosus]|uniref:Uncharacterized protein n=1 Tax=Araneus ventricosus TaxID=182803 RepID=A0A4Y2V5T9_ARAVE|nr:hypothetical protein AVEN_16526-1 [Araneus ventricosus]